MGSGPRISRFAIACALLLSGYQAALATDQPISAHARDIKALHAITNEISSIENAYADDSGDLSALMVQAVGNQGQLDPESANRRFKRASDKMNSDLARSKSLTIPAIMDAIAGRDIGAAVNAHKRWAALETAKTTAFLKGEIDIAASLSDQADAQALIEANSLIHAFQTLKEPYSVPTAGQ